MPWKLPASKYIGQAIESVLNQTTDNWRLVVIIDNGGTNDLLEIFDQIGQSWDTRISAIENHTETLTGALNKGMHYATTPFVCILHSDDLLDKTAIKTLDKYIKENPDIDFFHSSRICIDDNGGHLSSVYKAKKHFELPDFKTWGPVKHLLCWRVKSALSIGGMDESLGPHGADDYDFPWCMKEAGFQFKAILECLYYYRDHRSEVRLTTHVPLNVQINELRKIWKKHGMSETEIKEQIQLRKQGYLKQALFANEEEQKNLIVDMKNCWLEKYR